MTHVTCLQITVIWHAFTQTIIMLLLPMTFHNADNLLAHNSMYFTKYCRTRKRIMTVTISRPVQTIISDSTMCHTQSYKQSNQLSANQCKPVNNNTTTQHTQTVGQTNQLHSPAIFPR